MLEVPITEQVLCRARENAKAIGRLRNSIRKGQGNIIGCIGEIVVRRHLGARFANGRLLYEGDIVCNGLLLEVKSKECTSAPRKSYRCSVSASNPDQRCDVYVFVRVLDDLSRAWILGAMRKRDFFRRADFFKKGQVDPSSDFGWRFKADCFNIEIRKLHPLREVLN